jgi:succinoglycan biosynthesis transport protein ExoP
MDTYLTPKVIARSTTTRIVSAVATPISGSGGIPSRHFEPIPVQEPAEPDLSESIRRHYRLPLAAAIAGLLLAFTIAKIQTPMYRALGSIEIQDPNENSSPVAGAAQSSNANNLETQLRILQSNSLIERVVDQLAHDQLALDQVTPDQSANAKPQTVPKPRPWWSPLRWVRHARPLTRDEMVDNAARNLEVRQSRQATIVDLAYQSNDPQYAAAFVNQLAKQYMALNSESRQDTSRATTVRLNRQLNELRAQLERSEQRLQAYVHSADLVVTTAEHSPAEDRLRQIQENLSKAQENRIVQQARMETAVQTPAGSVSAPAGSALHDYTAKLTDLRRQRADLAAVHTPDFDGIKRLDAQIGALESAERSEKAALLQGIQSDYSDAVRREKLLQDSYHQQIGKVSEQAESATQYGSFKRAVETNQELYGAMLQRAAEARLVSEIHGGNARLVDEARVPRRPYTPNVPLHLLWGITLGLVIGLVFTSGRERIAPRFQDPGELRVHLRIPELGAIPSIDVVPDGWADPAWTHRRLQARGADPVAEKAHNTVHHANSPASDSFRAIITSILLSKQSGRSPQVIAITSAKPGEGKTTVTTNLAISLAQLQRRVLLIDGNLRQPRLHRIFNQVNNFGFGDLLPRADNSDLLPYVTHQTAVPNVWLATSGPRESGALDLLYSNGMAALMSSAREAFDFILIDTPAMRDLPDARILGRISDGVLLVVQSGTDRKSAKAATSRLQQDDIPVLGAVLNNWNRKS